MTQGSASGPSGMEKEKRKLNEEKRKQRNEETQKTSEVEEDVLKSE